MMLQQLTGRELVEVQAYLRLVGLLGPPREDIYNARIAMYAGGPYGDEAVTLAPFMPVFTKEEADRVAAADVESGAVVEVKDDVAPDVAAARAAANAGAV